MSKMRKLITLLLALTMVFACAVPSFATVAANQPVSGGMSKYVQGSDSTYYVSGTFTVHLNIYSGQDSGYGTINSTYDVAMGSSDAVDELLPQYKFKYETFDFANILISLQAKKVDIGAHQYGKTPKREETYLFGTQSYRAAANKIVVLKERNDISKLEDLHGKTVNTNTGNLVTEFLERYNKTLPEDHGTDRGM